MDLLERKRAIVRSVMDTLNNLEQERKLDNLVIKLKPTLSAKLPLLTPYSGDLSDVPFEVIALPA